MAIREKFYEVYQEEGQIIENFKQIEKYFRIERLKSFAASLIELGEINEEQKQFYKKELQKELEK